MVSQLVDDASIIVGVMFGPDQLKCYRMNFSYQRMVSSLRLTALLAEPPAGFKE
jgi:hypothetical protein